MFRSTRIDRYVLSELTSWTLLSLLLYTFIVLMNAFLLVAKVALQKNLAWNTTMNLFLCQVPRILVLTIPMATLLGVLIAVGRLSADHETVALQAAGLGPGYLLRPVVFHGLAATLLAFWVYSVLAPRAVYADRALRAEILRTSNIATDLRPRVFYTDLPGAVVYVDEIRAGSQGRLEGVLIYQPQAEGGDEELTLAREGDFYPSPDRTGTLEVDLREGTLHAFRSSAPDSYRVMNRFGHYHLRFDPPGYMKALEQRPGPTVADMGLKQLFQEIRVAAALEDPLVRSYARRRVLLELHQRIALPTACLLFAILGLPLGMTRVRTGHGAGFALSLLVLLVYWIVFTTARDQAYQGRFPVSLGAWAGNFLVTIWAVYAYWPLRSHRRGVRRLMPWLRRAGSAGLKAWNRWAPGLYLPTRGDSADWTVTVPDMGTSSTRLVGLIDRYIVLLYLRLFVFAMLSGYLVFTLVELKGVIDDVLQRRQSFWLVLQYLKYFAVGKADVILPIGCLVASVITFTLMSRTGELTAIKAAGRSMRRVTAPVLLVTLSLCGVLFVLQEWIAPVTNRKAQEVRDLIQGKSPRTYGLSAGGRWTFGSAGHLYHYRLYDAAGQTFQGLSVYRVDMATPRILEHWFCADARWNGESWVLGKGWFRSFPSDGSAGEFRKFQGNERIALDPPENFARREISLTLAGDLPDQLTIGELDLQIRALKNSGYDTTRLRVAYYAKFAQPLTPIVMVLLGLPFAFRVGRRGNLYGIGVAILLVIVYWATFAIFNALGLETILSPFLAAWAPNILYGLVGVYLMLYVRT